MMPPIAADRQGVSLSASRQTPAPLFCHGYIVRGKLPPPFSSPPLRYFFRPLRPLLSPRRPSATSFAPSAPSGGTWGDGSPRPPPNAHRRSHRGRRWEATRSARNSAMCRAYLSYRQCPAPLTRSPVPSVVRRASIHGRHPSGRLSGVDARLGGLAGGVCLAGSGGCLAGVFMAEGSASSVFMAGAWGEASPQVPPEARWTAGRSRGAS